MFLKEHKEQFCNKLKNRIRNEMLILLQQDFTMKVISNNPCIKFNYYLVVILKIDNQVPY